MSCNSCYSSFRNIGIVFYYQMHCNDWIRGRERIIIEKHPTFIVEAIVPAEKVSKSGRFHDLTLFFLWKVNSSQARLIWAQLCWSVHRMQWWVSPSFRNLNVTSMIFNVLSIRPDGRSQARILLHFIFAEFSWHFHTKISVSRHDFTKCWIWFKFVYDLSFT